MLHSPFPTHLLQSGNFSSHNKQYSFGSNVNFSSHLSQLPLLVVWPKALPIISLQVLQVAAFVQVAFVKSCPVGGIISLHRLHDESDVQLWSLGSCPKA